MFEDSLVSHMCQFYVLDIDTFLSSDFITSVENAGFSRDMGDEQRIKSQLLCRLSYGRIPLKIH
tara:strand:- start:364 stop:555 length:192 start_codon:yes stop_codon:yes gene_type:complete